MEDAIVKFETAKLAKERGFIIPTIPYYTPNGRVTESEGYRTERLECSNWNNGIGSYPTSSDEVECSAPTQPLLQKWLRDVHNIRVFVVQSGVEHYDVCVMLDKINYYRKFDDFTTNETSFTIYEEALEEGLKAGLELIKTK